jgi:hypothetical protein
MVLNIVSMSHNHSCMELIRPSVHKQGIVHGNLTGVCFDDLSCVLRILTPSLGHHIL